MAVWHLFIQGKLLLDPQEKMEPSKTPHCLKAFEKVLSIPIRAFSRSRVCQLGTCEWLNVKNALVVKQSSMLQLLTHTKREREGEGRRRGGKSKTAACSVSVLVEIQQDLTAASLSADCSEQSLRALDSRWRAEPPSSSCHLKL